MLAGCSLNSTGINFVHDVLVDYVQRFLGYCLTGNVAEQILAIFWGIGANGKSTLLVLCHV
jgi:putative DNA primase/helicase